ncbi:hypothetical protein [Streptomyces sp. GESEQ-4]|uniref:hypothetical protein n=1 Tax=Streptomyces sp. GESEQ-4 TaxID=2812655 RepID=UPI001B3452B9|nr:hypothetical protein [Streptomyces sp. GESEQ-4]
MAVRRFDRRGVAERIRALGNGLTILLIGVSEAVFFLVVLYNQDVLDFTPLEGGLAWLPFCLAFLPGVLVAGQLLPRVGMRTLLVVSMLVMACGMLMFSMVEEDSSVQQVGGALGLATFAAIALGSTHGSHTVESAGGLAVDGVRLAFRVGAVTLVVGAALSLWLMPGRRREKAGS